MNKKTFKFKKSGFMELFSKELAWQKKYDGYYYNEVEELIAFDTDLTKQKAGLVIRKDALDNFLDDKNYHLVWFVNAAKEVHGKTLMITKFTDWTGFLEYTGASVLGEYYIMKYPQE